MSNYPPQEKIFVGNGVQKFDNMVECSICLSDIPAEHVFKGNNGKTYCKVKVVTRREPDQYGKTHYVELDTYKPQQQQQPQAPPQPQYPQQQAPAPQAPPAYQQPPAPQPPYQQPAPAPAPLPQAGAFPGQARPAQPPAPMFGAPQAPANPPAAPPQQDHRYGQDDLPPQAPVNTPAEGGIPF